MAQSLIRALTHTKRNGKSLKRKTNLIGGRCAAGWGAFLGHFRRARGGWGAGCLLRKGGSRGGDPVKEQQPDGMSHRGDPPPDTTKTRSNPRRVGMCSGERPISAAKGKQTKTVASCQPLSP